MQKREVWWIEDTENPQQDEQTPVGREMDEIDHWHTTRPDVVSEAGRIRNGEDFTKWKDNHVSEAWDKLRELEKAVNTLGKINRNNRTEEALRQIDRALENAREKIKYLKDLLKGTEKADKNAPLKKP